MYGCFQFKKKLFSISVLVGAGLGIPYSYRATVMLISSIGVIGGLACFLIIFINRENKSPKKFLIIIVMLGD